MQPGDVAHRIVLTDADIRDMHAVYGHEAGDVSVDFVTTRSQAASKLRASGELPAPSSTSKWGRRCENCQYQIELAV